MNMNQPTPPKRVSQENKSSFLLNEEENQIIFELLGKRCLVSDK